MDNIWVMRDGTMIKIEEMETSHLINTLKMLERNAGVMKIKYASHLTNLVSGEEAMSVAMDVSQGVYEMSDSEFLNKHTQYAVLSDELSCRG